MSNGQTLGSTQIKTNVTKIDKKIKSVDGTWKDSAAATNGETRDFKATFTVPNKLAVDTITLEDHMTGIVYVDGSFHATTSSGTDVTNQFGTIGKGQGRQFRRHRLQGHQPAEPRGHLPGQAGDRDLPGQGRQRVQGQQGHQPDPDHLELAAQRGPAGRADPGPGTDETPVLTYDVNLKKIKRGRRQQGHPGASSSSTTTA